MEETKSSYRQIFKATGLFGGVQVLIILITLVRSKFAAIMLGTTGFGINLLNSPIALITTITGLGISYSAVRDISELMNKTKRNNLLVLWECSVIWLLLRVFLV